MRLLLSQMSGLYLASVWVVKGSGGVRSLLVSRHDSLPGRHMVVIYKVTPVVVLLRQKCESWRWSALGGCWRYVGDWAWKRFGSGVSDRKYRTQRRDQVKLWPGSYTRSMHLRKSLSKANKDPAVDPCLRIRCQEKYSRHFRRITMVDMGLLPNQRRPSNCESHQLSILRLRNRIQNHTYSLVLTVYQ